ncbi:MAG TPA: Crp/Fnr family transcriptional regulator [Sphingomicrobium sp.]|nr:Crp/Fnr family transcriptional regulator [Sphingomicrobium sp.]
MESRAEFSAEERRAFLGLPFTPVQVRPNHDFVRLGERVSHSTFVMDGVVGAFEQDRDGNRQITSIFIEADMVDLHTVVLPEAISALQALVPTTILQVPHSALRQIARGHPRIIEAFWRECSLHTSIALEWVVNVGRRDARTRMAHFYCELACRSSRGKPHDGMLIPYTITQFQLSDILGLTPVHVNRTLQSLRKSGLVESVEKSLHRVRDWRGLCEAGDFDPTYLRNGAL